MSEIDNSQLDGTNLATEDTNNEEIEINLEEETIEDDGKTDLEKELAKKDSIIRQLTARAKKAEAERKNFNKPEPKTVKEGKDDIRQTVAELQLAEQKRQFGYANRLSPEETDYLFKLNSSPTSDLLNDPFIKGGLEAIRKEKRVEANTPSLSSRSQKFELPKKADMSREDKENAFAEYRKARFGK